MQKSVTANVMCLVVDFILTFTLCVFFGFILLTWKLYLERIIFELYLKKKSLIDNYGLISGSQHEMLISQVALVLVCYILAEALLGNDKATYRGL